MFILYNKSFGFFGKKLNNKYEMWGKIIIYRKEYMNGYRIFLFSDNRKYFGLLMIKVKLN